MTNQHPNNAGTALIAMSGGVDSAVAAYLTQQQGYRCTGVTMRLFDNPTIGESSSKTCCSLQDAEDARAVASRLGMDFHVFNFINDFKQDVIARFINSYKNGETPNPCIDCNRYMKFDKLLQRAQLLEHNIIVTGHYARISHDGDRYLLQKAKDTTKDQSYVLYMLTQRQLDVIRFPLGDLTKQQVRDIAAAQQFTNANKRESQDICFVPDGNYAAFIERQASVPPRGNFLAADNIILGSHNGIHHYTIGQRKGLGISAPTPLYVTHKCAETNAVYLGNDVDLHKTTVLATDFNWIIPHDIAIASPLAAKIRYNQTEQPLSSVELDKELVSITFTHPQRAITPGQAVVIYRGDDVVGGGTIVQ